MSHWGELLVFAALLAVALGSAAFWIIARMADRDEIDEELDEAQGENDQPDGDFK